MKRNKESKVITKFNLIKLKLCFKNSNLCELYQIKNVLDDVIKLKESK